jgi:SAM-dependent methyltransferase
MQNRGLYTEIMRETTTGQPVRNHDAPAASNRSGPGLDHFFSDPYQSHNRARLNHLESLGLALSNRRVLELGSGPGDHAGFYVERQCAVVAVDARQSCLDELKRRHAGVQTVVCDLNEPAPLADLGPFDVIHCYGILYHLENPSRLIAYMGQVCKELAIVETCVLADKSSRVELVNERAADYTQSSTGRGCRPARRWVFEELGRFFPFVYHTRTQPNHPEFPVDWNHLTSALPLIRSVFVASKRPLDLPSLSPELLDVQQRLDTTEYIATLESGLHELALKEAALQTIRVEAERRQELLERATAEAERRQELLERATAEAERRQELLERATAEADRRQELLERATAEADAQRCRADALEAMAGERTTASIRER